MTPDELRDATAVAWEQGLNAGILAVNFHVPPHNPYHVPRPSTTGDESWRPPGLDGDKSRTNTPPASCRCEFGWAHDCPHHGNKETR
jgi:hypothetical protein